MPGFVDVSNMTALEVKRLGQMDDYDEDPRQPRRTWQPRTKDTPQVGYAVSDVWAAACAAQRVNGGYYKESSYEWDESANVHRLIKRRNREEYIENEAKHKDAS